jgi:proteasome accessory factor A
MSEFATAMKMGTTTLILELMEQDIANPDWILAESVEAMRAISRDQEFKWELVLRNGRHTTALELQIDMMQTARKYLAGKNRETDWIIHEWDSVLNDLSKGPEALIGRVDWATKYWMLSEFSKEENIDWHDPWLKSLDLEYHNLNKNSGLYWSLEGTGEAVRKTNDDAIEYAKTIPPRGTRADGRGELVKTLVNVNSESLYLIDWIGFRFGRNEAPFLMLDPFISYKEEIRNYLQNMEKHGGQESTPYTGTQ